MGKQDDVLRKFQILQELDVELGVSDRSDRKNVTNKTGQDRDRSAGGSVGALWGLKQFQLSVWERMLFFSFFEEQKVKGDLLPGLSVPCMKKV